MDKNKEALDHAIRIIQSYELDIEEAIRSGAVKPGFCQGSVYKEALSDIAKKA